MDHATRQTDPEDEIRASNELLKLKLELDHGMVMSETSGLPPEVENRWLQNIHDFEALHENAKQVKVYDFLKRPAFERIESLKASEVPDALERLESIMNESGISLDCCCEYDPAVIYRFITEEFFEKEMDNISMAGMTHCFIYEEFHPNHDHDIRRKADDFIRSTIERQWVEDFDKYMLADSVWFSGKAHTSAEITSIILAFQEAHSMLKLNSFEIQNVSFDLNSMKGVLKGRLVYEAHQQKDVNLFEGECTILFALKIDWWEVTQFAFPGFGGS